MIEVMDSLAVPEHFPHDFEGRIQSAGQQPPRWHAKFLELEPNIRRHAQVRFRSSPDREEAVQEVVARSLVAFLRLFEGGKEHLIYAAPLARFAVAQVRCCRRVGGRLNIRDVSSAYCRARKGVTLESLNWFDETSAQWQELLVEDRRSRPADIAAARIDIRAWLETLPGRNRCLAERLASGASTSEAARMFRISPARVSQLRRELHRAWNDFQREKSPMPEESRENRNGEPAPGNFVCPGRAGASGDRSTARRSRRLEAGQIRRGRITPQMPSCNLLSGPTV
jgi:DNA-directed RNA polymerase specialized sigma24 family protein